MTASDPSARVTVNGADLDLQPDGSLWWPARRTLIVADLHLEKGSSLAARGSLLPPYDTRTTLRNLAATVAALLPEREVALGDSFHDAGGAERLIAEDRQALADLMEGRDWVWVSGNHDPTPPVGLGGSVVDELVDGGIVLRHEARATSDLLGGEISGHFHPVASLSLRHRRIRARCLAFDGRRAILPAFGAYTGGLDVGAASIRRLFARPFVVVLLARGRLVRTDSRKLVREAGATAQSGDASMST